MGCLWCEIGGCCLAVGSLGFCFGGWMLLGVFEFFLIGVVYLGALSLDV